MALKLEMLRVFATVAESGNLTEAATRLGRTPSALSMTLKQFEETLNTKLFATDRKNRLTDVGAFVLEQAQNELRQFDQTVRAIENYASATTGVLRIAAVPSAAARLLPDAVARFTAQFPEMQLDIRDMDSASVGHELARGRIDIGIATLPDAPRQYDRQTLLADQYGLVAAADHPLIREGGAVGLEALAAENFITNDLIGSLDHPELNLVAAKAKVSAPTIISLLALVGSGVGVTVLPKLALHRVEGPLAFRPLLGLEASRRIEVFFRNSDTGDAALREFIATLQSVAE